MFGFGKRLTLSVALVAAGASAPVANDLDLVYGPKFQAANEALYNCMIAKTKLYATESEPATVVASAARQACGLRRANIGVGSRTSSRRLNWRATSAPRWLKTSSSSLSFVLRRSHAKAQTARLQPGP